MIYKQLLELLLEDLSAWDWEQEPEYELNEEMGKAILKLLERRENRNKFYRMEYAANREKHLEYQRKYNARKRKHDKL